jgi:hypothetical protein
MESESEVSTRGESLAHALARRVEGVTDLVQRSVLVAEFCTEQEPEVVAEGLQALLALTLRGNARDAWMALSLALCRRQIPYERMGEIYRAAIEAGFGALRMIFIAGDGALRRAPDGEFKRDDLLDGMTLGERKAKARTQDKKLLERLLFDADSAVVHILLRNPRMTVDHVLKLASKRPNRPAVLVEIAEVPQWVIRRPIRQALVLNPYSPLRLAVTVMPLMGVGELTELRVDRSLHPVIRETAVALLALRGWSPPTAH